MVAKLMVVALVLTLAAGVAPAAAEFPERPVTALAGFPAAAART